MLSLLAAAAFAVYSLTARPLVMRYGATMATAWSALVGLLMVFPFGWAATREQQWTGLSVDAWASLAFASVVSMLIAYTIWSWAIERCGVSRTVPYLFLVPIGTGVLAALLLGERFGLPKIAGALLVLLGTALVRLADRMIGVRARSRPVAAPKSTQVS